jgi:hypothetical protein
MDRITNLQPARYIATDAHERNTGGASGVADRTDPMDADAAAHAGCGTDEGREAAWRGPRGHAAAQPGAGLGFSGWISKILDK